MTATTPWCFAEISARPWTDEEITAFRHRVIEAARDKGVMMEGDITFHFNTRKPHGRGATATLVWQCMAHIDAPTNPFQKRTENEKLDS